MELIGLLGLLVLILLVPAVLLWGIKSQLDGISDMLAIMSEELLALKQMVAQRPAATAEEAARATPEAAETVATATDEATGEAEHVVRHEATAAPTMVDYALKQPEEALPDDAATPEGIAEADAAPAEALPASAMEEAAAPMESIPESLAEEAVSVIEMAETATETAATRVEIDPEADPETARTAPHDGPRPQAAPHAERNYEKFIGENLFGKVGILVFIIGIGYFVKYAIDKNWIGEVARTALGFAVGVGMLALAERLHRRYRAFSSLLAGGGFGVFYLTVTIAFHYYALFSQPTAFAILCATTAAMAAVALRYDRSELAVTALVGGFLAPFLVSTGEGNIIVLLTYLSILNIAMFALAAHKRWAQLPVLSFVFTYAITWLSVVESSALYGNPQLALPAHGFVTLFFVLFLLPIFLLARGEWHPLLRKGLLGVVVGNGFLYLLLGREILSSRPRAFDEDGLLALFIALAHLSAYLYLRRKAPAQSTPRSVTLGLTITFASIAVPLQFDGNAWLMAWTAETIILLWLFIKERSRVYEWGVVVLAPLTCVSYFLSQTFVPVYHGDAPYPLLLNATFLTNLFVSAATLAGTYLIERHRDFFMANKGNLGYTPHQPIVIAVGLFLLYRAFSIDFEEHLSSVASMMASLLTAELILLAATWVLRKRFAVVGNQLQYCALIAVATALQVVSVLPEVEPQATLARTLQWELTVAVAIHLAYVLRRLLQTGWHTREVQAYGAILSTAAWLAATRLLLLTVGITGFSAGFSLSLGLAAFVLMVVGMRSQSKAVRVVSLAEFGVVLAKLVISDVWTMPAVGKIIVFIGLGILLLVLSFLYQRRGARN